MASARWRTVESWMRRTSLTGNIFSSVGEYIEHPRNWAKGTRLFAYDFASTADVEKQNRMLFDLLRNATARQSADSAEDVISALASSLNSDKELLREFARQNGIRLRRG